MSLAELLRDPLAVSLVFTDSVPLSLALEQMSQPSSDPPQCLRCEGAVGIPHAACKYARRLKRKRDLYVIHGRPDRRPRGAA